MANPTLNPDALAAAQQWISNTINGLSDPEDACDHGGSETAALISTVNFGISGLLKIQELISTAIRGRDEARRHGVQLEWREEGRNPVYLWSLRIGRLTFGKVVHSTDTVWKAFDVRGELINTFPTKPEAMRAVETAALASLGIDGAGEDRDALVDRYRLSRDLFIEARGEDAWVVYNGTSVLNADGEWEYEPFPSSRTDEFIARTRCSKDEAFKRAALSAPKVEGDAHGE